MQRLLLSMLLSVGLALGAVGTALAQPGGQFPQTPVPVPNCSVDPNQTADPAAVAAAQRAIASFYAETNREWSMEGYASAEAMRQTEGNAQSEWLDQTLPLACGRLRGGYQGMNWVPRVGWAHQ